MPTRPLPTVTINRRRCFADLRLREFRAVDNPHQRIAFASVDGNPDTYTFEDSMTETSNDMTEPAKGNLIGFFNKQKLPGDKQPVIQGKLSLPGNPAERGFALWAHTSERTGATVLSGRAGDTPTAQIDKFTKPQPSLTADATIEIAQRDGEKGLTIEPHSILLFTNTQRDADNPTRPNYWGYYNPGGGERLQRVAAWARTDRNGNAMLTGNLQRDEPNRDKGNDRDNGPSPETRRRPRDREEERGR